MAVALSGTAALDRYHKWAFTPYKVPPIPAGSYDPSLDAQRAAASRGLQDTQADTTLANVRARTDYGIASDAIARGAQYNQEDYNRNVELLTRNYRNLGVSQGEQANARGVISGGALLQSAMKRAANQAVEQQGLDTALTRAKDQTALQQGQLALQYAPPDAGNPLGGRDWLDRQTALTRAQREDTQFGLDVSNQKGYQATLGGYVPPQKPKNEFGVGASAYRLVAAPGDPKHWLRVDSTGKVIGKVARSK